MGSRFHKKAKKHPAPALSLFGADDTRGQKRLLSLPGGHSKKKSISSPQPPQISPSARRGRSLGGKRLVGQKCVLSSRFKGEADENEGHKKSISKNVTLPPWGSFLYPGQGKENKEKKTLFDVKRFVREER